MSGSSDPMIMSDSIEKRKSREDEKDGKVAVSGRNVKRARNGNFHPCHLTMLKSLHHCNDDDEDDGDYNVKPETWKLVDIFLERKPLLMKMKRNKADLQSIHDESMQCQEEQIMANSGSGSRNDNTKSPHYSLTYSAVITTPNSLHSRRFSPHRSPSNVQSRKPNSMALISHLLGRKASSADASLREATQPFEPLAKEIDRQLAHLQATLDSLQQERLEEHRTRMTRLLSVSSSFTIDSGLSSVAFRQDEDTISLVETKIRLWQMLSHALEDVAS